MHLNGRVHNNVIFLEYTFFCLINADMKIFYYLNTFTVSVGWLVAGYAYFYDLTKLREIILTTVFNIYYLSEQIIIIFMKIAR